MCNKGLHNSFSIHVNAEKKYDISVQRILGMFVIVILHSVYRLITHYSILPPSHAAICYQRPQCCIVHSSYSHTAKSTAKTSYTQAPPKNCQTAAGNANLLLALFVKTFVIACRIVVPAFSISFLVRPVVIQIFKAGWILNESSLPLPRPTGMLLRRVIRTPLRRACYQVC